MYELKREITIRRPLEEVFGFFQDAFNLEQITPPWLRFEVLTPAPIAMRKGAQVDYRLRLRAIPIRWRTEITAWEPPFRFVDEQKQGPYRTWIHKHTFTALDKNATKVRDHVQYDFFGGPLIHRFLIAPDLKRIFDYRQDQLNQLFHKRAPLPDPPIRTLLVEIR